MKTEGASLYGRLVVSAGILWIAAVILFPVVAPKAVSLMEPSVMTDAVDAQISHDVPGSLRRGVIKEVCADGIMYLISLDFGMVKIDKKTLLPQKCEL